MDYRPARWLPGAHGMTVWANVFRPWPRPRLTRERWELPDGDFLDLDRVPGPTPDAPLVVACHGLEGNSSTGYMRGFTARARARGLAVLAMNFRSCSGTPNRLPRLYHSGETTDLACVLERAAAERPGRTLLLAGFSLGANVAVKYLGERGEQVPAALAGAVAISTPFDLTACAGRLDGPGFWNWVYRNRFLPGLRAKALGVAGRFPGLLDERAIRAARTFAAFDAAVTAPVHGFTSAQDYWARSSSGPYLAGVRRPLLAISALDDPLVPGTSIPVEAARGNAMVQLVVTPLGGHVGFLEGPPHRRRFWAEAQAVEFLAGLAGLDPEDGSGL